MEVRRGVLKHEDLCGGVDGSQGDSLAVPAQVVRCVAGSGEQRKLSCLHDTTNPNLWSCDCAPLSSEHTVHRKV